MSAPKRPGPKSRLATHRSLATPGPSPYPPLAPHGKVVRRRHDICGSPPRHDIRHDTHAYIHYTHTYRHYTHRYKHTYRQTSTTHENQHTHIHTFAPTHTHTHKRSPTCTHTHPYPHSHRPDGIPSSMTGDSLCVGIPHRPHGISPPHGTSLSLSLPLAASLGVSVSLSNESIATGKLKHTLVSPSPLVDNVSKKV